MGKKHKKWTMLLGRFQCFPPHKGHQQLVRKLLDDGKNVYIALREEDGSDKNPYTIQQRKKAFTKLFQKEVSQGRVLIEGIKDIVEVAYGRTPGWKITEIKLSKELESISGTDKRKENEKKKSRP